MTLSIRILFRLWISNIRLFCRYMGVATLWIFIMLFFFPYLYHQKYGMESSINLIILSLLILLLIFLEPLITHVVRGVLTHVVGDVLHTLPRYVVGGIDLAYVIIMTNLTTLAVSSLGIIAIILGIWISIDDFWQPSRFLLSYFCITIFPLIILGNYISVFRHFLGLRSDGTLIRRACLYVVLVVVASIPYLIAQLLESYFLYFIFIFLSIVVWYITIMRYVSVLAHRYLFNLLEST